MDEELLQSVQARLDRLRAGDQSAAGELVSLALERLRALVRQMLEGSFSRLRGHETDSVINSAYPQLVEALRDNPPATPRAFLNLASCIFRHDLIDLARRESHPARQAAPLDGSVDDSSRRIEVGTDTLEPSRLAEWTEFHRLVGELPDDVREVFQLHHYQGLTQAAIAAMLGLEPKAVSRMYQSALGTVSRRLREAGYLG